MKKWDNLPYNGGINYLKNELITWMKIKKKFYNEMKPAKYVHCLVRKINFIMKRT